MRAVSAILGSELFIANAVFLRRQRVKRVPVPDPDAGCKTALENVCADSTLVDAKGLAQNATPDCNEFNKECVKPIDQNEAKKAPKNAATGQCDQTDYGTVFNQMEIACPAPPPDPVKKCRDTILALCTKANKQLSKATPAMVNKNSPECATLNTDCPDASILTEMLGANVCEDNDVALQTAAATAATKCGQDEPQQPAAPPTEPTEPKKEKGSCS